ncbi:MAG: thiamine diphosphokinase [Clostridia bacterium]|nr:thiamine diphosphokinase [Clostridia bacterium]
MEESMSRCVIAGAAPYTDAAYLSAYLREDDYLIAADGGQHLLQAMGRTPDLLVADFDSSEPPCSSTDCMTLPTRKDDTDVLAAMREALKRGYREFLLLGCLGGRLDHTMANLFLLRFLADHGAQGLLVDEHHEISLLMPGDYALPCRPHTYFSLFPFGGDAVGVTLQHAAYPLENAVLTSSFPLGVSNEFLADDVQLSFLKGFLLLIVNI